VTAPAGAARVDLAGKTVMRGIVDAHGHPGFLDMVTGKMAKENFTRETYVDHCSSTPITASRGALGTGTDMATSPFKLRAERSERGAHPHGRARPRLSGIGPADRSRNDVAVRRTSADSARRRSRAGAREPDFVKIWVDDRNGRAPSLRPRLFRPRPTRPPSSAALDRPCLDLKDAKLMIRAGVEGFMHSVRDQRSTTSTIALGQGSATSGSREPRRHQPDEPHPGQRRPEWLAEPITRESISPALIRAARSSMTSASRPARRRAPMDACRRRQIRASCTPPCVREVLGGELGRRTPTAGSCLHAW